MDKLKVLSVEVKYTPLNNDKYDTEEIQTINPVTEINDSLIEDYINASNTTIGKDELLDGLTLIHENQQSRSK